MYLVPLFVFCFGGGGVEFPRVFPMSVFVTYFLYDLRERGRILPSTSFSAVDIYKYIPAADADADARSGVVKIKRLRVASRRRRR